MFQRWMTVCLCALVVWTTVTATPDADHDVVKRSDDTNPLEAVVSKLTQDMTQVQARVTALENAREKKAAFFARNQQADVTANTPIPFKPVFNIGNGYDATLNVFVAPFPGIYIFALQVYSHHTTALLADLMQNGNVIARARIYDATENAAEAFSVTLHVAAGDRFWVRVSHATSLYTGYHSFFSGTLIAADV